MDYRYYFRGNSTNQIGKSSTHFSTHKCLLVLMINLYLEKTKIVKTKNLRRDRFKGGGAYREIEIFL